MMKTLTALVVVAATTTSAVSVFMAAQLLVARLPASPIDAAKAGRNHATNGSRRGDAAPVWMQPQLPKKVGHSSVLQDASTS